MQIVPFSDTALDTVYTIQREAYRPLYEKYRDDESTPYLETRETIFCKYTKPGTQGYLFQEDGHIVGTVRVAFDPENGSARISALGVLPGYQGRGIAQHALLQIEKMHPEVKTWTLDTILEEPGNCHLYEKLGYKRFGEPKRLRDNMTLVFYKKQ